MDIEELIDNGGLYPIFKVEPHKFKDTFTNNWGSNGGKAYTLWQCTE